jgi:hypothetical protein
MVLTKLCMDVGRIKRNSFSGVRLPEYLRELVKAYIGVANEFDDELEESGNLSPVSFESPPTASSSQLLGPLRQTVALARSASSVASATHDTCQLRKKKRSVLVQRK